MSYTANNFWVLHTAKLQLFILAAICSTIVLFSSILLRVAWERNVQGGDDYRIHIKIGLLVAMLLVSLSFSEIPSDDSMRVSDDESRILQYLDGEKSNGIVFVYYHRIGRSLEAFGYVAVHSYVPDISLSEGWVTSREITDNTEISLVPENIFRGVFLTYSGQHPEWRIWGNFVNLSLANESQFRYALNLGLRYVIVEKESMDYKYSIYLREGIVVSSALLRTAPQI